MFMNQGQEKGVRARADMVREYCAKCVARKATALFEELAAAQLRLLRLAQRRLQSRLGHSIALADNGPTDGVHDLHLIDRWIRRQIETERQTLKMTVNAIWHGKDNAGIRCQRSESLAVATLAAGIVALSTLAACTAAIVVLRARKKAL